VAFLKRPYIQVARFLNEHSSKLGKWLDIAELKMVKGFFFDFGKMREREPLLTTRKNLEKSVAKYLLANGYSEKVKTPKQAKSVVRDALPRAIEEIELRMDWWGEEHSTGIPNGSSLALCPLDINVIEKLRKAGFVSIRQVSMASDESILKIRGVDRKRLEQVRSVCPIHTTAYQRKQEKARIGQGDLFSQPAVPKAQPIETGYVSRADRRAHREKWWTDK